jgi:cytochrome P450
VNIRRNPNRHIAFAYRLHFCVGARLDQLGKWLVARAVNRISTGALAGIARSMS